MTRAAITEHHNKHDVQLSLPLQAAKKVAHRVYYDERVCLLASGLCGSCLSRTDPDSLDIDELADAE